MAQIPRKIMETINKYLDALKSNNIPLQEAILFGSYARGNQQEWSDIDIALVSTSFKGNRIEDKDTIRKITLSVSSEIEVIPFSPNDFNLQNPLAKEIIQTGIKLL